MASLITVRITKGDSPNLGFRLQGGKDFGTPLVIQKVNGGSPAERAGLIAGDSVVKINSVDVFNLRHKDAQDVVLRAGTTFDVTIQRGGSTWKPAVLTTGSLSTPTPSINHISPVTKTSLAANTNDNWGAVGTGHNVSAKPFSPQVNGAVNGSPKVVNKQYNTPIKLYSDASIAETISAQTEVLSTGALGVNFKKNEKNYDASNSAVLRMLKESENEPRSSEEEPDSGIVTAPNSGIAGLRHVYAPENKPAPPNPQLPPGQNICADCERLIVGVFVRIKDKNLHVECFKCSTCGSSLKNVGYYNINNKLYCDIHAKSAAIRNNPNPNLVPITLPLFVFHQTYNPLSGHYIGLKLQRSSQHYKGGKPPAQAISSALATHSLPSPSPLSPKINNSFASPYQQQEIKEIVDVSAPLPPLATSNVTESNNNSNSLLSNTTPLSFSKFLNKTSPNYSSAPKPFSSVSAPLSPHSTLPRTAPLSPVAPAPAPSYNTPSFTPSYSPASSAGRSVPNIVWPPVQPEPELPTACPLFYPPPSQVEQRVLNQKVKRAEEEDLENAEDCSELVEINKFAQYIPNMSLEGFTERKSATECIETISETLETQKFVENILKTRTDTIPQEKPTFEPPKPQIIPQEKKIPEPPQINPQERIQPSCPVSLSDSACCQQLKICELKTEFTGTMQSEISNKIDTVPLKWESPLTQAIRTTSPDPDTFSLLPPSKRGTALASALAIAPTQPFTPTESNEKPVPLPEETVPYMPPERPVIPSTGEETKPEKPKSKFVKALETAPERPYSPAAGSLAPLPKKKDPMAEYFEDLPKPQQKLSMLAALTTAPDRSYSPLTTESIDIGTGQNVEKESENSRPNIDKTQLQKPTKPETLPKSFKVNQKDPKPPGYYPPIMYETAEKSKSEEHTQETNASITSSVEKQIQNLPIVYQKTEESKLEEHTEETNTSKVTTIEKQIQNPQVTQIIIGGEEQSVSQNFAPLFHGFSCSFQNKTDRSQFSVEINTTPPVMTPPPKVPTPIIKTIESQSGYVQKETVTEERRERQQVTKKQEQSKEEIKANVAASKQKEEIVLIKATPQVELHRVEGLPSYQVQLAAEAESNLMLLEKKRKAQEKMEQQKLEQKQKLIQVQQQSQQSDLVIKPEPAQDQKTFKPSDNKPSHQQTPVIKVESDVAPPIQQQRTFKPVTDERPPSRTFSPRPGAVTPSMINKPPPVLPYYQANLVPQHMAALAVNVFDPKSPAVSRSPSPCPLGLRSSSPLPHCEKPVSPAPGPPSNPLTSNSPLPTPAESRVAQARENISTYIPEYKSKRDLIERAQGLDFLKRSNEGQTDVQPVQMYTSTVQAQSYPLQQESVRNDKLFSEKQELNSQHQLYEAKSLELQEAERSQRFITQSAEGTVSTAIDEQSRQAHMEQYRQSQSQSVQRTADGTQVQRRKIVTEEFERTQKETNIQIEKNVSSTKKYPFREVNAPAIDAPPSTGVRFTDPQPITSPFIKSSQVSQEQQVQEKCQKEHTYQTCQQSCQKPSSFQQQSLNSQSLPSVSSTSASNAASASSKHVFAPSSVAPHKRVDPPSSTKKPNQNKTDPNVSQPNAGAGTGRQSGGISVAPRRGRGVLNTAALTGSRIPLCGSCNMQIRGPFITALGKIWCPSHFICSTPSCRRPLQDLGFVEERGQLYCEYCFEQYLAPPCSKCGSKIKGDCLKAIGKNFHPECFNCTYCGKLFGNSPFFLEDGSPYCEADWNELFTTKCFACAYPIEAGDRWVEALNNNYHSQCFNCTMCKKNLEGQSFFAKGGRPFCKNHAR